MPKKILLVDDNAALLDMLSEVLVEYGYGTSKLTNAEKVFERIATYLPDLIILDIMLGGIDGKILCQAIKDKYNIPVIFISGNASNAAALYQQGGADDFVLKPFDIAHILKKVEAQLAAYA